MSNNAKKDIGERLKSTREKRDIKQNRVAKIIGVHNSTLNKYESGEREPDNETLLKLSSLYDVSVEWILTGENRDTSLDEKSKLLLEGFDKLSKKDQEIISNLIQRMPKI